MTFTPSGGSATALTLVGQIENGAGRLVAIYELQRNPRSGATGAVTVTFSNSVGYGIVVGVANFTGVDTSSPLDGFASAVGTDASPTVTVANDADGRNELLFDTVFLGSAPQVGTLGVGAGQSQGWNLTYSTTTARLVGAGSTEEATGSSTIMSWAVTGGPASRFWAIGAVPINPAPVGTTYNLTMGVSPSDGGTTTPAVGVHAYPEGTPVDITATPNPGYEFDSWTGEVADPNSASTTVTMGADKTVTANFEPLEYTLTVNVVGEGTVSVPTGRPTTTETQVLLTATPAVGHVFAGWSGDLADGVNPQTVTMNSDKTVTATFEQYVPMLLGLDGAPSSGTGAANATSVSFSHTTGTGTDRLMLVGVSWNCGSADRTNSLGDIHPLWWQRHQPDRGDHTEGREPPRRTAPLLGHLQAAQPAEGCRRDGDRHLQRPRSATASWPVPPTSPASIRAILSGPPSAPAMAQPVCQQGSDRDPDRTPRQ